MSKAKSTRSSTLPVLLLAGIIFGNVAISQAQQPPPVFQDDLCIKNIVKLVEHLERVKAMGGQRTEISRSGNPVVEHLAYQIVSACVYSQTPSVYAETFGRIKRELGDLQIKRDIMTPELLKRTALHVGQDNALQPLDPSSGTYFDNYLMKMRTLFEFVTIAEFEMTQRTGFKFPEYKGPKINSDSDPAARDLMKELKRTSP